MAGINSLIPTMAKAPEINLGQQYLAAAQLRGADTTNELMRFNLSKAQEQDNDLKAYADAVARGEQNPEAKLTKHPQILASVIATRNSLNAEERTAFDHRIKVMHNEVTSLLPLRGTPQFATEWAAAMDRLKQKGMIDDQRYNAWRDNPSELVLQQALALTSGLDGVIKQEQLKAGQQFSQTVGNIFGVQQPQTQVPTGPQSNIAPLPPVRQQPAGPRAFQPGDNYQRALFQAESGNRNIPNASGPNGTPTSSAFGPGQFLESTWADLIKKNPDLNMTMADRMKPEAQAIMETRFRAGNANALAVAGVDPNDKNLYMAHFLGPVGAVDFIKGMEGNPAARGIDLVPPGVATANRAVFYNKDGSPRSAQEIYANMTRKFGPTSDGITSPQVVRQIVQNTPADMTIGGVPAREIIPVMAAAAANPMLPEANRKLAETMLKAALEENKPPEDVKKYQLYTRQAMEKGETPDDFTTWDRKNKAAARAQVTVDQKQETALSAELGKGLGQQINEMSKDGLEALDRRSQVFRLEELLDKSGTGAAVAFTNYVRSLSGINLGKNDGAAEAAEAMLNNLLPAQRQGLPGAASDRDMRIFAKSIPSLLSTPAGRKLIIETMGGILQARIERGEIAMQVQTGEITAKEAIKKIKEIGDPFTAFRAWQKNQKGEEDNIPPNTSPTSAPAEDLPRVESTDQLAKMISDGKIKSGQKVLLPDGRTLTVK